jgi:hypothetical protein
MTKYVLIQITGHERARVIGLSPTKAGVEVIDEGVTFVTSITGVAGYAATNKAMVASLLDSKMPPTKSMSNQVAMEGSDLSVGTAVAWGLSMNVQPEVHRQLVNEMGRGRDGSLYKTQVFHQPNAHLDGGTLN